MDTWTAMRLPLPPKQEQRSIVAFIDQEIAKIDALISAAGTGSAILDERRAALISAAVTGQIDVRGTVHVEVLTGT